MSKTFRPYEWTQRLRLPPALRQNNRTLSSTLVLVTADHDQSMSILGVTDTTVPGAVQNVRSTSAYPPATASPAAKSRAAYPGESDGFPDYADANGDGYPENTNRFRLTVGYRTGAHTGPRSLLRQQELELCCSPATTIKPTSSSKWQPSSAKTLPRWIRP